MVAAMPLPEKPRKPQRQRDRDTKDRDLIFDDHAQNYRMLAMLNSHAKTLALLGDALDAGNIDAAKTLRAQAADETKAMIALEGEDVTRHSERAQLYDFRARERVRTGEQERL